MADKQMISNTFQAELVAFLCSYLMKKCPKIYPFDSFWAFIKKTKHKTTFFPIRSNTPEYSLCRIYINTWHTSYTLYTMITSPPWTNVVPRSLGKESWTRPVFISWIFSRFRRNFFGDFFRKSFPFPWQRSFKSRLLCNAPEKKCHIFKTKWNF